MDERPRLRPQRPPAKVIDESGDEPIPPHLSDVLGTHLRAIEALIR